MSCNIKWLEKDIVQTLNDTNTDNFIGSPQKIKNYYNSYLNEAGPLKRLQV